MKICIDARCLMEGRHTGVEEYTTGLLEELFKFDDKNKYVLFINSWKEPDFDFEKFRERFKNVSIRRLRIPNKLLNLSFWYLGWPRIDKLAGGADVVFFPNVNFGAVSPAVRSVLTVHDLSFERLSEHFSLKRKLWHIFINPKKMCRRAAKIIAVSRSTKDDLISLYGIPPEKIKVVHSAVSEKFQIISRNDGGLLAVKEKYALPYRFILFLGTIEPRKNIAGLVEAYDALQSYARGKNLQELAKYRLVIVGEKGWKSESLFERLQASPYRNQIKVINSVSERDKVHLYNLSSLLVYPSFFEGFGFPPLEAMKCGVPVITSNNSSMPEVVGSAGILVDPDKPDEIFRAMREILTDKELKSRLIAKGLGRSGRFSWKKAAEESLKIFLEPGRKKIGR